MPTTSPGLLKPRKSPTQARSSASVEAMLDAALQVLVRDGKDQLTTTRVAERAGVSVGTLYQYFPNKNALLHATLRRHLEHVRELVCLAMIDLQGKPLADISAGVGRAFLRAKLHEPRGSVALYAVSSELDGMLISQEVGETLRADLEVLLRTAPEPVRNPALMSGMLLGAIGGISRRLVESPNPEELLPAFEDELVAMLRGYAAVVC